MSIQNEILNAIASRRSCRAYKPEQITAEELEAVTTAGTWAATAMGRQSPVMVAVPPERRRHGHPKRPVLRRTHRGAGPGREE